MTSVRTLNLTWTLLIVLTLAGTALGEGARPGFAVSVLVATITAVKGRLVIDHFMELGGAHPAIRRSVRTFGLLVPVLIPLVYLLGPQIADLTTL